MSRRVDMAINVSVMEWQLGSRVTPAPPAMPKLCNASAWSHRLIMAMHTKGSVARQILKLAEPAYPVDYAAACASELGYYVDSSGKVQLSANGIKAQLQLCQQQLATALLQLSVQQQLQAAAGIELAASKQSGEATAARLKTTEESLRAARDEAIQAQQACEKSAVRADQQRAQAAKALERAKAQACAAEQLLRAAPRTRREQAAQQGCCQGCRNPFDRAPCEPSGCCAACDEEEEQQPPPPPPPPPPPSQPSPPSPPSPPPSPPPFEAGWKAVAAEMTAVNTELKSKLKSAHAALAARERSHYFIPKDELYAAFAVNGQGEQRTADAAARAAQRAIEAAINALPENTAQCAVVLDAMLKRPAVREAAAEAGIRTAGDVVRSEVAMQQAREAMGTMFKKKGPLSTVEQQAVTTFLTFIVKEADGSVQQRGKRAKQQREAGGEVQAASVTDVRAWAKELGLPISTTWRQLKQAVERRRKLDAHEDGAYWLCTKRRRGHGLSEEVRRKVHNFYVAHPSIKRSPIKSDVLKIKDEHGVVQDVPKLLSEVSLTDVYLDFRAAHPEVNIRERAFRYLRPQELRRMKMRHLEMCGCRYATRPSLCGSCIYEPAQLSTRSPHV